MIKQVEYVVRLKPNVGWTVDEYIDGECTGAIRGYSASAFEALTAIKHRRERLPRDHEVIAINRGEDIPSYA